MVYMGAVREGKKGELVFSAGSCRYRKGDFTLFICFSRRWCFSRFFENFEEMTMDLDRCHLVLLDNSDDEKLEELLLGRAGSYEGSFKSVRVWKSWRLYSRPLQTAKNITWENSQLAPIHGMHRDAMSLCGTDVFVMIEDDTLPPPDAVPRLLSMLYDNPRCGFATGVQAMRQSSVFTPSYMGVYYVEREGDELREWLSPSPHLRGVHAVDGSGWYCFASYRLVFERALDRLAEASGSTKHFAADVMQVNNIKRDGFGVLADFSMWCGHYSVMDGVGYVWGRKNCRPTLCVWVPKWRTYAKTTEMKEQVHYELAGRLTRKKDRESRRN